MAIYGDAGTDVSGLDAYLTVPLSDCHEATTQPFHRSGVLD